MNNSEYEIIPAVMPKNYNDLKSLLGRVSKKTDWVQIDVMDGKFTHSVSWPYQNEKGKSDFEEIQNGDEGLPYWEDLNFSLDLMISNPYEETEKWINAGASRVILHWSSLRRSDVNLEEFILSLKEKNAEVCLAFLCSDDIESAQYLISKVDSVQFMGIEKIGFQGEPFKEEILYSISDFKEKNPDVTIGVDGSVNSDTVFDLKEAGVTRFVSGSYILNHTEGVLGGLNELREVIES